MQVRNAEKNTTAFDLFCVVSACLPADRGDVCVRYSSFFGGAAVGSWWSVTFLAESWQAGRQNVLRIVPIFTIANNSCLAGDYCGRLAGPVLILDSLCETWRQKKGGKYVIRAKGDVTQVG